MCSFLVQYMHQKPVMVQLWLQGVKGLQKLCCSKLMVHTDGLQRTKSCAPCSKSCSKGVPDYACNSTRSRPLSTAVLTCRLVTAGDRGFDPLSLSKPQEYLQFDTDKLDQNKAVNKAGNLIGKFTPGVNSGNDTLAPYDDVFGLERFRETELIHGRWAMLATLGVLVGEASTGVSWSVLRHPMRCMVQLLHVTGVWSALLQLCTTCLVGLASC